MDNPPTELRPRGPLNVCPACGGDWFRQVNSYEFQREETLGYFQETWPLLVGRLSKGVMTLLVCLCGSPLTPRIGGVRGGDTFNRELTALLDSLRKVLDRLEDIRSDRSVLAGLAGQPASPEAFAALVSRSENVERVLAQRIRRRPGRGRHWRSPKRKPRAKGRDQLVLAVEQRAGLTARKAREVVNQFWNIITRAIWRGENVETPLGVFKARSGTRTQQTRTRWGRQQTLYRQERRIAFRPSIAFPVISETPASKEDSVPQANVPSNQLICEKCGSTYFVEPG